MADRREYDIVLYGATGFTGLLTAEYLARHAPASCRWALAGRNQKKLDEVVEHLAQEVPESDSRVGTVLADSTDRASINALASSTRVLVTTVGPYALHGEPAVAACAETGTHYLDLTGEPEFVNRTYVDHDNRAQQTGAKLIHACGFDSIPHDLGAYFTLLQLPEGSPVSIDGYIRFGGRASGGTIHSAINGAARIPQNLQAARARKRAYTRPTGRKIHAGAGRPHRFQGHWALPAPTIDSQIIGRSADLVPRYGSEFTYNHHVLVDHLSVVAGVAVAAVPFVVAAQIPPTRRAMLNRFPAGEGPSPERRAQSFFEVIFAGRSAGQVVTTHFAGGDPGYDETAKMLSESALCIAFDDVPDMAGQVTTAAAMGDALIPRLQKAGLAIEIVGG